MTALETLLISSLDISTVVTDLYSTYTCLDGVVSDDMKITTIACSITAALNSIEMPDNLLAVRTAQAYVESLSEEQLLEATKLLEQREIQIEETKNLDEKNTINQYIKSNK